jgi:hypothetical protein
MGLFVVLLLDAAAPLGLLGGAHDPQMVAAAQIHANFITPFDQRLPEGSMLMGSLTSSAHPRRRQITSMTLSSQTRPGPLVPMLFSILFLSILEPSMGQTSDQTTNSDGTAVAGPNGTAVAGAEPSELRTTLGDQQSLAVTIYNDDLALVKDRRALSLPAGRVELAFRDVSARIRPQTALLRDVDGSGLTVIEQNFDFDLLTPAKLLEKYVGRQVGFVTTHPTSGERPRSRPRCYPPATAWCCASATASRPPASTAAPAGSRLALAGISSIATSRPTCAIAHAGAEPGTSPRMRPPASARWS